MKFAFPADLCKTNMNVTFLLRVVEITRTLSDLKILTLRVNNKFKCLSYMGQSIQERTKKNFLKAVFHKFDLVHSSILYPKCGCPNDSNFGKCFS